MARGHAVLDAEHPFAQQLIEISIDAEALPHEVGDDAVRLYVLMKTDGIPPPDALPIRSPVDVYFIDADSGYALPRLGSAQAPLSNFSLDPSVPSLPIDCSTETSCTRHVLATFMLADPDERGPRVIDWEQRLSVVYPRSLAPCHAPSKGSVSLTAQLATVEPASSLRRNSFETQAARGELAVRHLSVRVDGVPQALFTAVLRLSVSRPASSTPLPRGWVRVLADDGTRPLADGRLGQAYNARTETIDVPVLSDCSPGRACSRGYWIVFDVLPSAPNWDGHTFGAQAAEAISWDPEIVIWAPGAAKLATSLVFDDADPNVGLPSTLETPVQRLDLPSGGARGVDVTLSTVRAAAAEGLEPSLAAIVVADLDVYGYAVTASLSDAGPTGGSAYFNGHYTGYLLGHPLDACANVAVGATCATTFRLVAVIGTGGGYGGINDSAQVNWRVRILGAPPSTSYVLSSAIDLPGPSPSIGERVVPLVITVGVVLGAVLLVLAIAYRRRRRIST
jgi:hypothetical protein